MISYTLVVQIQLDFDTDLLNEFYSFLNFESLPLGLIQDQINLCLYFILAKLQL